MSPTENENRDWSDGYEEGLQTFIDAGNKLIKECQEARKKAKDEGDYSLIKKFNEKGIYIQDDDAESIDAEGFWKELKSQIIFILNEKERY
jgi:hypothetical protein